MLSVLQRIIEQYVHVHKDTGLTQIHTSDVNNTSVCLILSVLPLLHVKMRNVSILANVQGMLIAHRETTEEFAHASLDSQEIHMALHALQVRVLSFSRIFN